MNQPQLLMLLFKRGLYNFFQKESEKKKYHACILPTIYELKRSFVIKYMCCMQEMLRNMLRYQSYLLNHTIHIQKHCSLQFQNSLEKKKFKELKVVFLIILILLQDAGFTLDVKGN